MICFSRLQALLFAPNIPAPQQAIKIPFSEKQKYMCQITFSLILTSSPQTAILQMTFIHVVYMYVEYFPIFSLDTYIQQYMMHGFRKLSAFCL